MKRMKKLLALALSGVMALSCTIFASADSTDYISGSQTGQGVFESLLPDGHVRIVLPTTGTDTFDMILDPHSLIKDTGGARYSTGSAPATFEGDNDDANPVYLFFHNSAEDAEFTYSSKSDQYSIINKSSFPVDMKVSVEVDKGLAGSSFEIVEKDKLADAEGAAMYLGLEVVDAVSTDGASASDPDTVTPATNEQGDPLTPETIAVSLDEDADKVTAPPTVKVDGVSIGSSGIADTDKAAAKAVLGDVTVSFPAGTSTAVKDDVVKVLTTSQEADATASLTAVDAAKITVVYTKASGAVALTPAVPTHTQIDSIPDGYTVDSSTASIAKTGANFSATDPDTYNDAYFTMSVKKGSTVVAKIRGKINAAEAVKVTDNATAEITFAAATAKVAPLSSAVYSKEIAAFDAAYGNVYKSAADGYILAYYKNAADFPTGNEAAQTRLAELQAAVTESPAEGLLFNLVGAINNSDDWDNLNGADNNIEIAVIWDISEAASRAKKPVLSVDSDTGTVLTLKWTAGTGKYADYAPKVGAGGAKYSQNGTAKTLTTAAGTTTDTFKVNGLSSTIRNVATNTNYVVVFQCTGKDDIEIDFPSGWKD